MPKRPLLQSGHDGAEDGTIMTQTSGIQGGPETGIGHGHIRESGIAIGGGSTTPTKTGLSTGAVGGDFVCGQAHKTVTVHAIADTRAATGGRRQKNETRTKTLAVASIADENTGDARAETTRKTRSAHHEHALPLLSLPLPPAVHVVVLRLPRPSVPLRSHRRHFLLPLSRPKWTNTSKIRTTLVLTLPPSPSLLCPTRDLSVTQSTKRGMPCWNFYANAERTRKRKRG